MLGWEWCVASSPPVVPPRFTDDTEAPLLDAPRVLACSGTLWLALDSDPVLALTEAESWGRKREGKGR